MAERELSDHLLRRSAATNSFGDIVLDVRPQNGHSFPAAEALVERVRVDRSDEVARRQLPFLLPLAAASIIGGVAARLAAIHPPRFPSGMRTAQVASLQRRPSLASRRPSRGWTPQRSSLPSQVPCSSRECLGAVEGSPRSVKHTPSPDDAHPLPGQRRRSQSADSG